MTSASELFYTRRSRFGRTDVELRFDSPHNNRRHRHPAATNRRDLDGCDSLRRSSHSRHAHHRHLEHDPVWLDQNNIPFSSFDVNNLDNSSNIRDRLRSTGNDRLPGAVLRSTGNDRLPGAVLLARERLLQRLRGASLSGSSHNNRNPSSVGHRDLIDEDDFRLPDGGDWETRFSSGQAEMSSFTNSLQQEARRPPGLTKEAINCLHVEDFSNLDRCDKEEIPRALPECSICLESFLEGDKLLRLSCGHGFHCCCLEPWVRICACCPYCRKDVVTMTKP